MDALLEKTLVASLERVAQGEPVELILADYPEQAEALRPHLITARSLQGLAAQPTVAAQRASRERFLSESATLPAAPAAPVPWWARLRTVFAAAAAAFMVLMLLGSGLVIASRNTAPGDTLYGLKRTIENYQLSAADDPEELLSLTERFQQERRDEVALLLSAGREEPVQFAGTIEAIEGDAWIIAGLPVRVLPSTTVEGEAQVGREAEVAGRTVDGAVTAESVVIPDVPGPLPDPTPEADLEPTPTLRPTITATPYPSATPSPSATATATVVPTATPLAPSPTAVFDNVVPPAGGNDNADAGAAPPDADDNDNAGDDDSDGSVDEGNDNAEGDDQSNDNAGGGDGGDDSGSGGSEDDDNDSGNDSGDGDEGSGGSNDDDVSDGDDNNDNGDDEDNDSGDGDDDDGGD